LNATLIDGKAIARSIRSRVQHEVERLSGPPLHLVSLGLGDDLVSAVYMRNQRKACESAGIQFTNEQLPADAHEVSVIERIKDLNEDPGVTGIIVQRPLRRDMNPRRIQAKVHPDKDVEGLNPANIGAIVYGEPKLVPCTALAAIKCAQSTGIELRGKNVAVVGHSEIVGKPISFMMLNYFATVTICHIATQDLAAHTRDADVVFVAVGKPALIRGEMIKEGAVVVDIGIAQAPTLDAHGKPILDEQGRPRYHLAGDVHLESVGQRAGYLTPVPGGVGPVTVAMLLHNTLIAAKLQRGVPVGAPDSD
jgi:methylenetetrahydrofolate dehydrogenase (NADP+)/methenyltetrahydrofolate cyclohydrolase